MPYDANKLVSDETSPDVTAEVESESESESDGFNPFLQFVDPTRHRLEVERALSGTEVGRLITPLSRLQQRKGGASVIGNAWDEELADDAA
jgi:hypothetical protein